MQIAHKLNIHCYMISKVPFVFCRFAVRISRAHHYIFMKLFTLEVGNPNPGFSRARGRTVPVKLLRFVDDEVHFFLNNLRSIISRMG